MYRTCMIYGMPGRSCDHRAQHHGNFRGRGNAIAAATQRDPAATRRDAAATQRDAKKFMYCFQM